MSRRYDPALQRLVESVGADSPEIAPTVDDLAAHDRREVNHLVRRDRLTPDAALAVIRGQRQAQRDALARRAHADRLMDGLR